MKKILISLFIFGVLLFASCAKTKKPQKKEGFMISSLSSVLGKKVGDNNPVLPNFYCADPTAVVYDGRLYVIGTNDQQMYKNLKAGEEVNYGYINTLAVMSTVDMANWTFHGEIDVKKAAPWAGNSWAPSIASRVENDGKTHFYLYFANGGNGIGVLTATSPLGPWKDPLGKALISRSVKGLGKCDWLFDPGVVIDDKGEGYLSFGGGPGSDNCKIVKLGKDMVSLESDIVALPETPKHFEANELNYVNGTYILSYCNAWEVQPAASMCYMTSKTPLDASSWKYGGAFFDNTGTFDMGWGNNHSHIEKYNGIYYMIYQAHDLHKVFGVAGDCRNINIDEIKINENDGTIEKLSGTRQGAKQLKNPSAFEKTGFGTLSTGSGFKYLYSGLKESTRITATTSGEEAGWIMVKSVDFSKKSSKFTINAKGKGLLRVYADAKVLSDNPLAEVKIESTNFVDLSVKSVCEGGNHDLYFMFTPGIELEWWQFE